MKNPLNRNNGRRKENDAQKCIELLEKYRGVTVIVEGSNDRAALEELGCSDIVLFTKPAYSVAEELESRGVHEVCILTDLDSAGKRKYMQLKRALTCHGIRINDEVRHYLFTHTQVSHIEGLATYVENMQCLRKH